MYLETCYFCVCLCYATMCLAITPFLVQGVLSNIEKDELFMNVNYESGKANFCKQEELII
jgi:hypothetical protein